VKLSSLVNRKNRIIRTRSWSEAANIVEHMLASRYLSGPQIGDSVTIKYVHEEWDGQWQHHYKIIVKHLDTKCATCGFPPAECVCDSPVV
jgi:hypothetical protein